jgi:hypothetical protein
MSRGLQPVKKYRRYTGYSTREKVYRPLYRGLDIVKSQFPPAFWQYARANDAQEHAERHEIRKRLQIARFQDVDYRTAVLTRYAALALIAGRQEEENE